VEEPYLGGTPDVGAFTGRLLFYRFSFGEAAYAAQPVLSWQTTIVGDPLYRPAAKLLPQLHVELQAKQSPLVDMSHLRVVELAAVKAAPLAQILAYLEQVTNTASSAVLSEKLGDVCTAMGKPSSAIFAYERALDCDPSRQQRVRLRLTLAEKLIEAGEDTKAYEQYRALIEKDWPQYPGRLDVARKLLPLALKLDKTSDAAKWETLIQQLSPPPQAPAARAGGTNK
jgi:tetratricopeptide (TPR) repeat protein